MNAVPPSSSGRASPLVLLRQHIGLQLIGALLSVFLFFLVVMGLTAYVLYRQDDSLKRLFSGNFERVMIAGDLARDAEVLNAQALERLLGVQKSTVDGSPAVANKMDIFQNSRDRLLASGLEGEALREIDRRQSEYFSSLTDLEGRFQEEEERQQARTAHLDALHRLSREFGEHLAAAHGTVDARLGQALQALLACTLAAEVTGASGPLQQLGEMAEKYRQEIRLGLKAAVPGPATAAVGEVSRRLDVLSREVFFTRGNAIVGERATLAATRETRVLAQRLAGAAYNLYQAQRQLSQAEMIRQEEAIHRTLLLFAGFGIFAGFICFLAVLFIIRHVTRRLNALNQAMGSHVAGERVPIPQEGQDEIAAMGRAFEIFVQARDGAEAELRQNQQLLAQAAVTDILSGLPNRRGFDAALQREWNRCARNVKPLSLLMVDIDFFKAYNDHYGHPAGDEVIRRVGQAMRETFDRAGDYPARYGGEEFVCILPETDRDGAAQVGERFRQNLEAAGLPHACSSVAACITVSVGVASLHPQPGLSPKALLDGADGALYAAKRSGRNQVCTTAEEMPA